MKRYIWTFILVSLICFNVAFARRADLEQALELHRTIVDGNVEKVKSLLSDGVDINSRNRINWTPLHTAIDQKNNEIIQLLLDKNADVNSITDQGETPLHFAVKSGQKDVVEKLIAKGADVNILDIRSDNALSLSRKGEYTEITELLLKHGAKEPSEVMNESRMYDRGRGPGRDNNTSGQGMENRPGEMQSQRANEANLLADPNEIKARIKTFEGLEKSIADVNSQSQLGMRRWRQTRIDNRATLVNNVQRQIQEEIEFIRKTALEEKASRTVEAADVLLAKKKDRTTKIVRGIKEQEKEKRQTRSTSTSRGGGRSSRGGGRTGAMDNSYTTRSGRRGASRADDPGRDNEAQEQVDPEEQNEIDQWLQADVQDYDGKVTLFTAINEQVMNEFGLVRQVSEQEQAKKTTASIDGLLLARKIRYDELNRYIQEEKAKLEQQEEETGRTRGGQADGMGQDDQAGGRRRRR